nr:Chain E, HSP90 [Homo sapiens]2C2L_F Chain F, HSP90 [Homo sapiens]2C2L_G Chain G, HSP90 [Homo sapiens]2C2L_H Chain H, HSP90 [Homo sapiens]6FDP_B Chain B, Heat shock protein HSP 90-alpha [Homo sapiens]
DTSRMEEVD